MNHKNRFTCPFSGGSILIIGAVARVSCEYARWLVTRVNQERSAPAGVYHPFFHQTDRLIENHGDDAQENDRQDHPVKFEDLTAVDNEKSQSLPGSDEFTDDNTNQTEPDIDFHNAQKIRDRRGQCHTQKFIFPFSTEGTDEFQRIRINFRKAGIQIQDGAEDRNGDPGKDDRLIICTEPYDQQRSQCRLQEGCSKPQGKAPGSQQAGDRAREGRRKRD